MSTCQSRLCMHVLLLLTQHWGLTLLRMTPSPTASTWACLLWPLAEGAWPLAEGKGPPAILHHQRCRCQVKKHQKTACEKRSLIHGMADHEADQADSVATLTAWQPLESSKSKSEATHQLDKCSLARMALCCPESGHDTLMLSASMSAHQPGTPVEV